MRSVISLEKVILKRQQRTLLYVDDFSLKEGEILGVVGPNGAGKSTFLKVLSLLENPTSGKIFYKGAHIDKGVNPVQIRRQMSVVFQHPIMLDTTVYRNVAAPLKMRHLSKIEVHQKVYKWMARFGIDHLSKQHAKTLSGGEAQRVALARAMVTDPEVLFLDEPFSALDLPTKKSILRDFSSIIKETNTTIVFVSHDFLEVAYLCRSLLFIDRGKLLKKLPTNEINLQKNLPIELLSFIEEWMTPLGSAINLDEENTEIGQ